MNYHQKSGRRSFFGLFAKGTSALGLASIFPSFSLQASASQHIQGVTDLESWLYNLKGKHKIVFDAISVNDGFQVVWAYTFMTTHNQTGTPDKELGALVVLRNKAIPLAMDDSLWKKYKLGKFFKIVDRNTNATSERNLYWNPKEGEMPEEGMSIKALQERGVMFCVCETALALNSSQLAKSKGLDPAEAKKEWMAGLLPGIQPVPSGVWALNRAQERGASYCYAG